MLLPKKSASLSILNNRRKQVRPDHARGAGLNAALELRRADVTEAKN